MDISLTIKKVTYITLVKELTPNKKIEWKTPREEFELLLSEQMIATNTCLNMIYHETYKG